MLCTQKEDCSLSRVPNGYGWESSCSTNETVRYVLSIADEVDLGKVKSAI